jgi:hypothetical protein
MNLAKTHHLSYLLTQLTSDALRHLKIDIEGEPYFLSIKQR